MKNIAVLVFNDFETLDVFGPVEIFGVLTDFYQVKFYSLEGGQITNRHGVTILTEKPENLTASPEILLIPGGYGTRKEVDNSAFIQWVKELAQKSDYVLTVCTGAAVLARTGLLDNRSATSNKRAFDWVITQGEKVNWIKKARWVVDDKFYTSSGVCAGMDMCFGFLSDRHGFVFAEKLAYQIEYAWQTDKTQDAFYQGYP